MPHVLIRTFEGAEANRHSKNALTAPVVGWSDSCLSNSLRLAISCSECANMLVVNHNAPVEDGQLEWSIKMLLERLFEALIILVLQFRDCTLTLIRLLTSLTNRLLPMATIKSK